MILTYVIIMLAVIVAISVIFRIVGERAFRDKTIPDKKVIPINREVDNLEELIPVITAVAYTVFKRPVTVRRIKLFDNENESSWNLAGQLSMMSSHKLR